MVVASTLRALSRHKGKAAILSAVAAAFLAYSQQQQRQRQNA